MALNWCFYRPRWVAAARTAAATAASAFGGAVAGGYIGVVAGGLGAALNGGDCGDVLRGTLIGGVLGAITGGLLHGMEQTAGTFNAQAALHIAGHGVVGGASERRDGREICKWSLHCGISAFVACRNWAWLGGRGGTKQSELLPADLPERVGCRSECCIKSPVPSLPATVWIRPATARARFRGSGHPARCR